MDEVKPGFRAYLTVCYLLLLTLAEAILMPFRLAIFLLQRKKATHEICRLIENQRDKQRRP